MIIPLDFERPFLRLESLTGIPVPELRRRISASGLVPEYERGRLESGDFVRELAGCLGVRLEYEEFRGMWGSVFLPETLVPEEMILALKGRYRLLMLSNTNALHYEMVCANYPVLAHFDAAVLSYRVGAIKPEPRIYEEAIRLAGCGQGECFFTDDIPAYVEAARAHGIDAVQFTGLAQLRVELRQRQITL